MVLDGAAIEAQAELQSIEGAVREVLASYGYYPFRQEASNRRFPPKVFAQARIFLFEQSGEIHSEKHFSTGLRRICALCMRLAFVENMFSAPYLSPRVSIIASSEAICPSTTASKLR